MNRTLADIFTQPDPSVTQEGSVDPMGLLVIWQEYATRVFQRKLNSVATDPRAIMVNVLHHSAIWNWRERHPDHAGWESSFDRVAGLLVWAEDVLAHAVLELERGGKAIDTVGMLGLSKLKGIQASSLEGHPLVARKERGILKSQLALGYTGRYKAALVEMDLFDDRFERNQAHDAVWSEIEGLIEQTPGLKAYRDALIALFESVKPDEPRAYDSLPAKALSEHLAATEQAFSRVDLPQPWREFWRSRLGLTEGASGAIAEAIGQSDEWRVEEVMGQAAGQLKQSGQRKEAQQLEDILWLEPVLTGVDWFFDVLLGAKGKKDRDVIPEVRRLRSFVQSRGPLAASAPNERLLSLWAVLTAERDDLKWLHGFLDFHQQLMNDRDGMSWITLREEGQIWQQYTRAWDAEKEAQVTDLAQLEWRRSYYVHSVANMMKVLR